MDRAFRERFRIPREVAERVYDTSPVARHFYSEEEIDGFIRKWAGDHTGDQQGATSKIVNVVCDQATSDQHECGQPGSDREDGTCFRVADPDTTQPAQMQSDVALDYSQFGEQAVILKELAHFGRDGRFLDIGAADGRQYSNTLALAERGWGGVCVEANPHMFTRLLATHEDRPSIQCVLACLYHQRGLVKFFHSSTGRGKKVADGEFVSTTEDANRVKWQARGVKFTPLYVASVTPGELLAQFPQHFDFVSIDTEGTSVDLWMDLFQRDLGVTVWCIEHDGRAREVEEIPNEPTSRRGTVT